MPPARELIKLLYPPYRALHAYLSLSHRPYNYRPRRDRAAELRSRVTPIY
jgi:hypothetical protein